MPLGSRSRHTRARPLRIARRHNLPAELSSFVGRERELSELSNLLSTSRLVTVTGPAGVGKTRVALRVGSQLVADFTAGVWLAELARLADSSLVPQVMAESLGIKERAGQSLVTSIADALGSAHLLLIVDNCEHVVQACAELVEYLLMACPELVVLATSREPLGVAGEHVWPLPSLGVPPSITRGEAPRLMPAIAAAEAVRLFVDRVTAVAPRFKLVESNAAAVAEVCTRLDGIPLAIELAAAHGRILSPEQIAARLDDRLQLLVGGSRTAPPRQRTLRAALEWSYSLLSLAEQRLFDRLSVFTGGWTLEAAETICAEPGQGRDEVLHLLGQLASKSLVLAEHGALGHPRYRLLVMLQEYGWERLSHSDELGTLRDLHADYFLDLGERAEPLTWGRDAAIWWERLEAEIDNLRVALRWLVERKDAERGQRLGAALVRFWQSRNHVGEGHAWLSELRQLPGTVDRSSARARLIAGVGVLASYQADYARGRADLEHGLAIAREIQDEHTLAGILFHLSQTLWWAGDHQAAWAWASEGVEVARRVGHTTLEAQSTYVLGGIAYDLGDNATARAKADAAMSLWTSVGYERGFAVGLQQLGRVAYREGDLRVAERLLEQSVTHFRAGGMWQYGVAWDLVTLGWIATDAGELAQAHARLAEALLIFQDLGVIGRAVECLEAFAYLAVAQAQWERALRLAGSAAAARAQLRVEPTQGDSAALELSLQRARKELGPTSSEAAWAAGLTLAVDKAASEALESGTHTPTGHHAQALDREVLTAREREVAALAARGYTSKQIADKLVIAPRTAETHLERIYTKLDVRSRAQLTRWVVEHDTTAANAKH